MIRFESDAAGVPQIVLTEGQRSLISSGLACGLHSFEMRTNTISTTIKVETVMVLGRKVSVVAEWWATGGRFRQCWVEALGFEIDINGRYPSLSKAIGFLQEMVEKRDQPETPMRGSKKAKG